MKALKNIWGALLIIGVVLPMLLFLNPFTWGMRRAPEYVPSARLEKVLEEMKNEINEQEEVSIEIYNNQADLWYLRDCQNQRLDALDNFTIELSEVKNESLLKEKIKKYVPLIEKELVCKCFDSLMFTYELKDNSELKQLAVRFKIK